MQKIIKTTPAAVVGFLLASMIVGGQWVSTGQAQTITNAPKIRIEHAPLESPQGMSIYETRALKPRPDVLEGLMKMEKLSLKTKTEASMVLYQEPSSKETGNNVTRMILDRKKGDMIMFPNVDLLARTTSGLLPQEGAFKAAQEFVMKEQLIPDDGSDFTPQKLVTWSKTEVTPDRKAKTMEVLQTVLFQRTLDKKPMMGKGSQLSINVASGGQIVGLNRTWNQVEKSRIKPEFYSQDEIYRSIENLVKERIRGSSEVTVKKPHLVYYSNDGKYVAPAYFFTVAISSPGVAQKSFYAGVVPAAKNSPEAMMPPVRETASPIEIKGATRMKGSTKDLKIPNDPTVGRYVVRNDSGDWVDDANEFKDGLNGGHAASSPPITFGDYFWDEPFCWTSSANSFVNKWNIALMEGHGANWLFSTSQNCCDLVDLNDASQPGYGNRSGGSMRFLVLKGCSIIPAPPDRADWDAPWWRIFKGLRQAVGFRTEMYIDDDISGQFATWLAQNCQVIDSLFCATDNSSSYQWERFWGSWGDEIYGYGSAVTIPGDDFDGIYSIAAAPAASSKGLSIWWQH